MIFVVLITNLMRKTKAITSLKVGLIIMPFSAFFMASGPWLQGIVANEVSFGLFSLHPITVMMIFGIAFK